MSEDNTKQFYNVGDLLMEINQRGTLHIYLITYKLNDNVKAKQIFCNSAEEETYVFTMPKRLSKRWYSDDGWQRIVL